MQVDFLLSRLQVLYERIDDTEDLINIELDHRCTTCCLSQPPMCCPHVAMYAPMWPCTPMLASSYHTNIAERLHQESFHMLVLA